MPKTAVAAPVRVPTSDEFRWLDHLKHWREAGVSLTTDELVALVESPKTQLASRDETIRLLVEQVRLLGSHFARGHCNFGVGVNTQLAATTLSTIPSRSRESRRSDRGFPAPSESRRTPPAPSPIIQGHESASVPAVALANTHR